MDPDPPWFAAPQGQRQGSKGRRDGLRGITGRGVACTAKKKGRDFTMKQLEENIADDLGKFKTLLFSSFLPYNLPLFCGVVKLGNNTRK